MLKRALFLLPLVLMGVLLFAVYRRHAPPERAGRPSFLQEGESIRKLPAGDWPEPGPARREPAVLSGVIYDPHGRPVRRAEVASVLPRPYELVFSGPDGRYELFFDRPGRFLVEARLTIDMAPQRVVVEVPEDGDPGPLDFHLKPTGHVFGEVVVEQSPVFDGGVDIYVLDLFGDKELAEDTDVDNGFFNFYWAPPKNERLQIIIETDEGYMTEPVEFTYAGEPVNLGRIRLVRYPTLKVRMRLPDGSYAEEVRAAGVDALVYEPWRGRFALRGGLVGRNSKIIIAEKSNVFRRLVLESGDSRFRVIRDVELLLDQLRELEVVLRPGPFAVRRRLADEHGRPMQARLRLEDGTEAESGPGGFFSVQVPHGGVFAARITALLVGGSGWLPLREIDATAFLFDADDSSDCRFPLGGRVLVIGSGALGVHLEREGGASGDVLPATWEMGLAAAPSEPYAVLSRRLEPGAYRWVRGTFKTAGSRVYRAKRWRFRDAAQGQPLAVLRDDLAVLDLR